MPEEPIILKLYQKYKLQGSELLWKKSEEGNKEREQRIFHFHSSGKTTIQMQNTNHLQSLISLSLSLPIINSFHDVVTREKESYTVSIHEEKEEQREREREAERNY